jgi:phosphoribosylpyrophosphate synthetase
LKVEDFLQTGMPFVIAQKKHNHQTENALALHQAFGKILGQKIGIFDDMGLSLTTLSESCEELSKMGAKQVYAFIPHFDPTEEAYDRLVNCFNRGILTKFVTTNSTLIQQRYLDLGRKKFDPVDISSFVGDVINSIIQNKSTSPYFTDI